MGEVNNFQCRIKLTESMEQSWNFKLVFFMSSDAGITLHQEYFLPFGSWKNMFPLTSN